jgi:hypothetical protein
MQKIEQIAEKYTPEWLKKACIKFLSILPKKMANWIYNNKAMAIIIFFTFRGLFLRPSMWILYAAIFAYFQSI